MKNKICIWVLISLFVFSPAVSHALSFQEAKGQVKAEVVYQPVWLNSSWNTSLKISMAAKTFSGGQWNYVLEWHRARKDRQGSVYVSPKSDAGNKILSVNIAQPDGSAEVVLQPATRYRVEFYGQANSGAPLLLRKFFTTLASPEPVACTLEAKMCPDGKTSVSRQGPNCEFAACPATSTPPFICDYAAPRQGCHYEQGPNYNSATQCGLVMKCDTATSTSSALNILSPNGGESWAVGSKQNITWQAPSSITNVKLELIQMASQCATTQSMPGNTVCSSVEGAVTTLATTTNAGSFNWRVDFPPTITTKITALKMEGQYKIRVSDSAGNTSDTSDGIFYITRQLCPMLMCAAPPAGMCYKADPNNSCGCGVLVACTNNE